MFSFSDKAIFAFVGLAVVALIAAAAVLGLSPSFAEQTVLGESAPQAVLEQAVVERHVSEPTVAASAAKPVATPPAAQPVAQTVTDTAAVAQHDMVMHAMAQTPAASVNQAAAQPLLAQGNVDMVPDVSYTLTTGLAEGKLVFIGVGGNIDGVINPELHVEPNSVVQITLVNGDGAQHDWAVPELNAKTDYVTGVGSSSVTVFRVGEDGTYTYLCTVPGHQAAGMEGTLHVGDGGTSETTDLPSIVRNPSDLPGPIGVREPTTHDITLTTVELEGQLADGTSYRFWTFDGLVPGPFLRVRVGDTVNLTLENAADSTMIHSVDFHATTGPGGGAAVTQTQPGKANSFTFKAINPGLYVYHCATPMVAHHITNGMYGLILVEPEEGLPEVDKEFYVMQGELYTDLDYNQHGHAEMNVEKLLDEQPEYVVFNGAVGSLTEQYPLQAEVGETVRIFFGVGGPNFTSSFHVIGEIFDHVYDQASLTSAPLTNVQTTTVAPGGATMVDFKLEVPGRYVLVDHALSRMERGLVGFLIAEGEENHEIFNGTETAGSGH